MMYVNHIIARGDTVQRIARHYGIADWRSIVEVNQLRYPYIISEVNRDNQHQWVDERGAIRILGQTILIPSVDLVRANETVDKTMLEEATYGLDLDLTSIHRRPDFQPDYKSVYGEMLAESGDLKIARGMDNLRQALLIRLSTPVGTLELHPYFGSRVVELIGEKRTSRNITKMRLEAERTLLSDVRVTRVESLSLKPDGVSKVWIDCKIYPINPVLAFRFNEQLSNLSPGGDV